MTKQEFEAANLPEVNEALAKSLGIADATVEGLRADIKKNLEREVKFRLLARNKQAVMDALVGKAGIEGVITGRALYDGRLDLAAAIAAAA